MFYHDGARKFILACGLMVLFTSGDLFAQLTVINDGTTTTNLAKLSNANGSGGGVTTLAPLRKGCSSRHNHLLGRAAAAHRVVSGGPVLNQWGL